MATAPLSNDTVLIPTWIDDDQILSALAGNPSGHYYGSFKENIVITSEILHAAGPPKLESVVGQLTHEEQNERTEKNRKLILNFAILDKTFKAYRDNPITAHGLRFFLTDVVTILNIAPSNSAQFFLLTHLANRYDSIIETFARSENHEAPRNQVKELLLPTRPNPDGRKLTLLEGTFLEYLMADFHNWVSSSEYSLQ